MLKIDHMGKLFKDTYRVAMHKHDLWEVVYYSAGNGHVQMGDELLTFEKGDVFIIPPKMSHSDWAEAGFQDVFMTFSRCDLSEDNYYRFKDNSSRAVLNLLNQMYEIYFQNDVVNRENILNISFDLFFQYAYSLINTSSNNCYVDYMKNMIVRNFSDVNFSVNAVVEELHLNVNYARTLFVKNVGCTPAQFLMEKRIEYAKQLLASRGLSNYSISEISHMCGFLDPYYFSRAFRKSVGVSPKEWGKQNLSY